MGRRRGGEGGAAAEETKQETRKRGVRTDEKVEWLDHGTQVGKTACHHGGWGTQVYSSLVPTYIFI